MIYSDVIKNNYHKLLKEKSFYTKWDLNKLRKKGFSFKEARFIIMSTAIFYNVECSNYIRKYRDDIELMFI